MNETLSKKTSLNSKVYVVQEPVRRDKVTKTFYPIYDLSPASMYGEIVTLLDRRETVLTPAPVINALRRGLKDFSDDDYLIAIGDPVAIGMATAVAADMNRGKVNMLKWDRALKQYMLIRIDMNHRS